MSLSLAITDNADGTGGVATVSGVGLATVTLDVGHFGGVPGPVAFDHEYTRVNDGTIPLPLSPGFYFAYATVSLIAGQISLFGMQYFALTKAADAVQYRAMQAVRARLQSMLLDGIDPASIVVKKIPLPRIVDPRGLAVPMPAIIVSPVKESLDAKAGVNALDDVTLPVLVTLVEPDNQEATLAANLDRHTKWRERIERAFHNQRLPGVPEIYVGAVEPGNPLDGPSWSNNLYASGLLLKFTARVPRGLNA